MIFATLYMKTPFIKVSLVMMNLLPNKIVFYIKREKYSIKYSYITRIEMTKNAVILTINDTNTIYKIKLKFYNLYYLDNLLETIKSNKSLKYTDNPIHTRLIN